MTTSTRKRHRSLRGELASPLFRWGFTVVALASVAFDSLGCALVAGGLAWAGWRLHRTPRRRRRR